MDIKEVTKSLLSAANVKAIAGKSGATQTQVKSVLSSALPSLLGGKDTSADEISKETGVSKAKTNGILSAAGPLLSGLLGGGSQQQEEKPSGTAALLGSLLSTVNIGSLASGLMNLVSADSSDDKEEEEEKPKPKKPQNGKKTETSGKKPASGKKKTESSAKKPASGKKTSSKKDTKKEEKDSSPLGAVTDLLGGLFK